MADIDPVDVVGGVEGKSGVDDSMAEVGEEVRAHRRSARPYTPTKAEWEEHLPLHLNYRDWCEECVRAKGLSAPHRSIAEEALDGVTWNMDYCFLGDNLEGDLLDDESDEKQKGKLPVLVVFDDCKETFWTMPAGQKGPTEGGVKFCVDRLEDSGYIGETIARKSDQ